MGTTPDRLMAVWLECDGLCGASDLAAALVDEDVAAGEYEGCSTELELAYSEYLAAAERLGA